MTRRDSLSNNTNVAEGMADHDPSDVCIVNNKLSGTLPKEWQTMTMT